jgi:alpha-L-fucosidase
MKKVSILFKLIFAFYFLLSINVKGQDARPRPSKAQLAWHEMEFYFFVHFGPNTFTDKEWGHGDEPEDIFNPTQLDCRQWARTAKRAGAKGIIITAKHHDGFCLWPSKYSKHTVRESKWRNGKGDVLKELSQACKEYGLKFGVYISPWDRNHPKYGTPQYNDVFVNMMKEIFTNYGPIWELWWDGANGEGPNGKKQVYDWDRFKKTVKTLSPNTVVFSDVGPHIRWVGNENGIAGKTNWNYLDTVGFTPGLGAPSTDILNTGNMFGKTWIPAECDVSIRPGWFWHENENDKVKTPEQLFDLYLKSVGRGANLLLNIPPDRRGKIHANDSAAVVGLKKLIDKNLGRSLTKEKEVKVFFDKPDSIVFNSNQQTAEIKNYRENSCNIIFDQPKVVNTIFLKEDLKFGQRVKNFVVQILDEDKKSYNIEGTTIGFQRILTFPQIKTSFIAVRILDSFGNPLINRVDVFLIDEKLVEK